MSLILFDGILGAGYQLGLEVTATLYEDRTGLQTVAIHDTVSFGRLLALDGVIQTTEHDEFIYHEMLAHVPILAHGAVTSVCIIGGGDGGLLREVLKHPGVTVTLVEIDTAVIDLCREYLPRLSAGAFDRPQVRIVADDGARFLAATDECFDIVMVDSTDPLGPAESLFGAEFYGHCRRALRPGGILVTQNGVPMTQAAELTRSARRLRRCFADVTCYLAPVPTYFGGHMAFGWASDDGRRRHVDPATLRARVAAMTGTTRYHNPGIQRAAFALPTHIQALLAG